MRRALTKRLPLVLIAVLIFVAIFSIAFSATSVADASNESTPITLNEFTVGHLSDIHYFPLDYCYQDVKNSDYVDSDFYYSMTGDTKLVLESGAILNGTIQAIIADANSGIAPQYIVASGDLSKNGERAALIDVANAMRYLQNEVRKINGYSNFQVFATPGNHDLYNGSSELYTKSTGASRVADGITSAEFALIFAGLGYPNANLNGNDDAINLTDYLPESYWSSEYTSGYVESYNASNFVTHYYNRALQAAYDCKTANENLTLSQTKLNHYLSIGDSLNSLTFAVEFTDDAMKGNSMFIIDSTDREVSENGIPVRLSRMAFENLYSDEQAFAQREFYLDMHLPNGDVLINTSSAASKTDVIAAFEKGDNVYIKSAYDHITGGRITQDCLDWLKTYSLTQTGDRTTQNEESYIATFHHNALPHFSQEDDILKDFTLYNWEYVCKSLLDIGVRYVMTGHMHSTDVAIYTDTAGRTLYDMETGSSISYDSPRRYVSLTRTNCDGKLGEQFTSSVHSLERFKETASSHINSANNWNESAYQQAISAYNAAQTAANWKAVLDSNPDYFTYILHYDRLSQESYNEYINEEIYSQIVDRLLSHFINEKTISSLTSSITGMLVGADSILPSILSGFGQTLNGLAMYLIDTLIYELYPDGYPYNGELYDNAYDYITAVAYSIVNLEFGDETIASAVNTANKGKMNVAEIAAFILMSHNEGIEVSFEETNESITATFSEITLTSGAPNGFKMPTDRVYRMRFLAALKDFTAQCDSGELVEKLLDTLIDPVLRNEDSLLKTLLSYKFDLRKAYTPEQNYMRKEYITKQQYDSISRILDLLPSLLQGMLKTEVGEITIDTTNLVLSDVITMAMPLLKNLLGDSLGFNIEGTDLIAILEGFLDDYLVESFYVGIGGIAKEIVVAFATDESRDVADMNDTSVEFLLQPYANYAYGGTQMTYVGTINNASSVASATNPATQKNGRVPSRVTANFDTIDSTEKYTFKFYTDEDIYATFRWKSDINDQWQTISTSSATKTVNADNWYESTASNNGVTISTVTKPVYLPLIDLGLLCITHGEIGYEYEDAKGNDAFAYYKYNDRDSAPANSVIYRNVTTVTVTGLSANTTYYYDLVGTYSIGDEILEFSLADFAKQNMEYSNDYFTFTTAMDENADAFEFITIADIQGMVENMYTQSYNAMKAILGDNTINGYNFILNAGDMCDNGKNFNQWAYALDTYLPAFANTSTFLAAGNHEKSDFALNNFYNYSLSDTTQNAESGLYYSFDYANAHFVVLNTNDTDSKGLGATQLKWLKNDLKNNDSKWTFVIMHKSLYSTGSHSTDTEVVAMRNQLVPLFNTYGVDIVFGGHDHTYAVTSLVDSNGNVSEYTANDGVTYAGTGVLFVTLGTMGTKYYQYNENPNVTPNIDEDASILSTLDSQTFGRVVVNGNALTYIGYEYNSTTAKCEAIATIILGKGDTLATEALRNIFTAVEDTYQVDFFGKENTLANPITSKMIPAGYSVAYIADGVEYANINQIKVSGASVKVDVVLKNADGSSLGSVKTLTIEKENFALNVSLFVVIPIVVLGGVAAIVIVALKRKKKAKS